MENKLKLSNFMAPLISLSIYYLLIIVYGIIARENISLFDMNENKWWGIVSFVFFVIFLVSSLSLSIKMIANSVSTLKLKNLGGFSKILRTIFSLGLIVLSGLFSLFVVILGILLFSEFGNDLYNGLDGGMQVGLIGISIIKGTIGCDYGIIIDGVGPLFWLMFVIMLIWCGGGIVTALLTRPKKPSKNKNNND